MKKELYRGSNRNVMKTMNPKKKSISNETHE
jgi:hypothetical protein